MRGVCITVISIVRVMEVHGRVSSAIDGLVAVNSLFFLAAAILSYFSLRSTSMGRSLERVADLLFLAGLVLMVGASFLLVWEFGQAGMVPH